MASDPRRPFEWRLTRATQGRFRELMRALNDCLEESDEYKALEEEIRCLPGFPQGANPDSLTYLVTTDITG